MKLISATPSPYARKVRIQLIEKGLPFELITEVPWNDDTTVPAYNPLEKLPVLILDDGRAIYESAYILEWIERMHPQPSLMPTDRDAYLEARRYMVLSDGICDAALLLFFERLREPALRSEPWMARQLRKVERGLEALSREIATRDFAVGNALSLADISVAAPLGWLRVRAPDLDWATRHPNLAVYYDRLSTRESFKLTVPSPQVLRDKVV
jgi:glutathione S-transferase